MYSLTYTAAYDPYHTVFRMLGVASKIPQTTELDFESFRIADFFHCFPWLLGEMSAYTKTPQFLKQKNKIVRQNPKPKFGKFPDSRVVFERMFASQLAAKTVLENNGVFITNDDKSFHFSNDTIGPKLKQRVDDYVLLKSDLVNFLSTKLLTVPLFGPGGLKDRSGLSEFRYDII